MDQLPVHVRAARTDVGEVRPGAQTAELNRRVVEKISSDALAKSPSGPRDVRAGGVMCLETLPPAAMVILSDGVFHASLSLAS